MNHIALEDIEEHMNPKEGEVRGVEMNIGQDDLNADGIQWLLEGVIQLHKESKISVEYRKEMTDDEGRTSQWDHFNIKIEW